MTKSPHSLLCMGLFSSFLKDWCPFTIGEARRRGAPAASPHLRLMPPYSSASSTRPITSTTKPAAVAAAKDRSTLSMMPPRCRRATFPPWLRRTVWNLADPCVASCAAGCRNWDGREASLRPARSRLAQTPSGACKPDRLVSSCPVDQHRVSIPSRRPRSPRAGFSVCGHGRTRRDERDADAGPAPLWRPVRLT